MFHSNTDNRNSITQTYFSITSVKIAIDIKKIRNEAPVGLSHVEVQAQLGQSEEME